jgi:hypothetical protein
VSGQSSAPVKIGDRSYLVDLSGFARRPLNSMRQMVDQGGEPGERTLDNQGVWPRTQWDFVLGAGQEFFDEIDESTRRRHRTSTGCDVLSDRRLVTTLKKAQLVATLSGTAFDGKIIRTPSNFWISNESVVVRTSSHTSFSTTTITGGPTGARSLVYYGGYVYVAFGSSQVYRGTVSGSSMSLWASESCSLLHAAHGRLIGAYTTEIFELSSAGSKTSIHTHPDTNFGWTAICAAPNGIYAAGTNGSRTEIYLITVIDATGALAPPIPVAELPAGERVTRMAFFGGYLHFATTRGVRIGNVVGGGAVVYGPLLAVGNVRSIHTDGRFAYYTRNPTDGVDTDYGIGRLSLERFTSDLVPAYCPDLLVGNAVTFVWDVASDEEVPVFMGETASQTKVYKAHDSEYEEGVLYSGRITFGIPEQKAAVSIEARWDALPAGARVQVEVLDAYTGDSFGGVLDSTEGSTYGKATFGVPAEAEEFEVKVTLTPNPSDPSEPVTLRRWTLRAVPMPFKAHEVFLPLIVSEDSVDDNGQRVQHDVRDEWDYLTGLEQARTRTTFTFGSRTELCYVDGVAIDGGDRGGWHSWNLERRWPNGTVMVRLITVEDGI